MDRFLTWRLAILLLVAIGFAIFAHVWLDWDSSLLNVSAELVGTVVTVYFIDMALSKRDEKSWRIADERVYSRLGDFLVDSVTCCRIALQYGFDVFDGDKLTGDRDLVRAELIRIASSLSERGME